MPAAIPVPVKVGVALLAPGAASSYARMIRAGMPESGFHNSFRTRAEQERRWKQYLNGTGNLAARPGTSNHEFGVAMDVNTGSAMQKWLVANGKRFGWIRDVSNEPWHFHFIAARDTTGKPDDKTKRLQAKLGGLTVDGVFGVATLRALQAYQTRKGLTPDGIDGPKTWAALDPAPVVTTPPPPTAKAPVLLGVANCQSYDGDKSEAAWRARGKLMRVQGWNVIAVTETSEVGRNLLLDELGKSWKVITLKGKTVAVLFDGAVFSWRPWRTAGPWSPFGHGSVAAPLHHRLAEAGVDVIAHHTRPKSIATDAQKDGDIRAGAKLAGKWATVFAGDFARNSPDLPGWRRVTPNVDTMDNSGNQRVDAAFIKGSLVASNARVVDPGRLSDHKWLSVDLAFGTVPTN